MNYNNFRGVMWDRYHCSKKTCKLYRRLVAMRSDDSCFVVFPSHDSTVNYYGLLYIDTFLLRQLKKTAIILTSDEKVAKAANLFSDRIKIVIMNDEIMESLLCTYTIFDELELTIVSFDKPSIRRLDRLVGYKGFSVEELVAIGIYFIIPFQQIKKNIDYEGQDSDVLDIVKEGF